MNKKTLFYLQLYCEAQRVKSFAGSSSSEIYSIVVEGNFIKRRLWKEETSEVFKRVKVN